MNKMPLDPGTIGGSTEPYRRPEQIAALYSLHKDTPYYWTRKYGCPYLALPGGIRFRVSEVETWLRAFHAAKKKGATQP